MNEQVRHFRLKDTVYTELKVMAARQNKKVGTVIEELVNQKINA